MGHLVLQGARVTKRLLALNSNLFRKFSSETEMETNGRNPKEAKTTTVIPQRPGQCSYSNEGRPRSSARRHRPHENLKDHSFTS